MSKENIEIIGLKLYLNGRIRSEIVEYIEKAGESPDINEMIKRVGDNITKEISGVSNEVFTEILTEIKNKAKEIKNATA